MRFDLIPHWHLYWRNPGASGAAPTLRWTLPEGWTIGDLHWPVPKRIRVGPLTNYGYEDTVTLLVPVRIPETPLPTGPLILIADAEWLVCRVECLPEAGRLTLEINPGASSEDADTGRAFAEARAQGPEALTLTGYYRIDGDALKITVDRPARPYRRPAPRRLVRRA